VDPARAAAAAAVAADGLLTYSLGVSFFAPLTDAVAAPDAWIMLVVGYFAGSIPFGLILALLVGKTDVRAAGSGNIGATNVARVVGRKLGILTLFLDALKGAVPVLLVLQVFALPEEHRYLVAACTGLCAFLGHCFPVWLKLRGGKGVATGAGVLFALTPIVAGVGLACFAVTFAVARRVSIGSLVGAGGVLVAMPLLGPRDFSLYVVLTMLVVLVLRHKSNIQRILRKEELKV
jgi:glycerol-3-phosphate acyltransferase PlsY